MLQARGHRGASLPAQPQESQAAGRGLGVHRQERGGLHRPHGFVLHLGSEVRGNLRRGQEVWEECQAVDEPIQVVGLQGGW